MAFLVECARESVDADWPSRNDLQTQQATALLQRSRADGHKSLNKRH